ncbi:MAG: hypothetical protein K8L97_09065 [Anaerolineae bacterium]|nr:hypothetical protein [Anaerolineae bacterium]
MDGLQAQFGDRIDFVGLNIDVPETLPIREQFDMVQRSTYALIDAQGNIIQRWYGYLDQEAMTQVFNDYLAGL